MTTPESKEERLERVLRGVLLRQYSILGFLQDILDQPVPEGKTQFDLLCEKLEQAVNETEKT